MRFIPSCTEFISESERESQAGPKPDHVFRVKCAVQRTPANRGRRWIVQETACAGEEGGQSSERHLPELAERDFFIGLETLEPHARSKLVPALGERDLIRVREKISRDVKVATIVAPGQTYLRLWIGGLAAAHNNRSHGVTLDEAGNCGRWAARSRLSGKQRSRTGKPDPRPVHHIRRQKVPFFQAQNLLPQIDD